MNVAFPCIASRVGNTVSFLHFSFHLWFSFSIVRLLLCLISWPATPDSKNIARESYRERPLVFIFCFWKEWWHDDKQRQFQTPKNANFRHLPGSGKFIRGSIVMVLQHHSGKIGQNSSHVKLVNILHLFSDFAVAFIVRHEQKIGTNTKNKKDEKLEFSLFVVVQYVHCKITNSHKYV